VYPETIRWKGKLSALYLRHEELVKEMNSRGYVHKIDLDKEKATGKSVQNNVDSPLKQMLILKAKACDCKM
jgi:hypothetical protein